MTLLFRIVYAAHANGTHHKLALDALRWLRGDQADAWRRLFLKDAELFLQGSKAPDKDFKDFTNHVLHVGDNYWGGAPGKARRWYDHLLAALKAGNWSEAVWCAGVLSHYYTDPIMPLHTGQSDAETAVHRGIEWSVNKSYDELRPLAEQKNPDVDVVLPDGPHWLEDAVIQGAETSHQFYETLIAHYDIERGSTDPRTGLNQVAKAAVADLLLYASMGFARILERAFIESGQLPPQIDLTAETVIAGLKIPVKWVERKLADAEDRRLVQAMYDELTDTGKVERNLPEDDRVVRAAYNREVLAPRLEQRKAARHFALSQSDAGGRTVRDNSSRARHVLAPLDPKQRKAFEARGSDRSLAPPPELPAIPSAKGPDGARTQRNDYSASSTPPPVPGNENSERSQAGARTYLTGSDTLAAAPSIGTKTAARLATAGLLSVSDLLGADVEAVAKTVGVRHITSQKLTDWQDQSRLVMTVPGLRGTHAQLLVGAGYRTTEDLVKADPSDLAADILKFATTSDGERVLRNGNPPDLERIKGWIDSATEAMAA